MGIFCQWIGMKGIIAPGEIPIVEYPFLLFADVIQLDTKKICVNRKGATEAEKRFICMDKKRKKVTGWTIGSWLWWFWVFANCIFMDCVDAYEGWGERLREKRLGKRRKELKERNKRKIKGNSWQKSKLPGAHMLSQIGSVPDRDFELGNRDLKLRICGFQFFTLKKKTKNQTANPESFKINKILENFSKF